MGPAATAPPAAAPMPTFGLEVLTPLFPEHEGAGPVVGTVPDHPGGAEPPESLIGLELTDVGRSGDAGRGPPPVPVRVRRRHGGRPSW